MKSHTTPERLLNQFLCRDRSSRRAKSLFVYQRGCRPRASYSLRNECCEDGYFSGASSGWTEEEVDEYFASTYEVPFTSMLPSLGNCIPLRPDQQIVCAEYVAHLFRRSPAFRNSSHLLYKELDEELAETLHDDMALKAYAAKVSISLRRPISLPAFATAIKNVLEQRNSPERMRAAFVDEVIRGSTMFAKHLRKLSWTVLRTASPEVLCISDTPVISRTVGAQGTKYGVGADHDGVEWFLPISPTRILRGANWPRRTIDIDDEETRDLNVGQIMTMTRSLYSRSIDLWLDAVVQQYGGAYKYFKDVYKTDRIREQPDEFDLVLNSVGFSQVVNDQQVSRRREIDSSLLHTAPK